MISLKELQQKALRPWTSGAFLKSVLRDEPLFPLEIAFRKPSGKTLSQDYGKVRDWIALLHNHSKAVKGSGYTLEYRSINHQQLGPQRIPVRIHFVDREDWLGFIGKVKAFRQFDELAGSTRRAFPGLLPWLQLKPLKALELADSWPQLLKVCRYFQLNPQPGRYIRQLDIQGVDSKFIENHKGVLSELLSQVLDPEDFDATITGLAENGFERRFGLRFDEPLIRYRLLDSAALVTDITVPVSQFIDPGVGRVFITENKVNGLAFPAVSDAMVIFGLGYGIQSLSLIDWLRSKEISYWGDIDTHGFAILSRLRHHFPRARSLLMDETTLTRHLDLCTEEPENKRFTGELAHLTPTEQQLFSALKNNRHGKNLRLEQERIGYGWLLDAL
ncbi:DUF3322 domain-containing protein [Endozoicomonas sp. SCSIO W0465]|uniref:DUF3322 domain-containing protein n=1 Tax=Endozoicomonas sp. SCSIO W0465 TaxID=2918516 RepID=UPI002074BEDA|nr:DUF3322 domain-containing protein [Endozoicomonas sp. SCSIO W0465]USE38638.1 DUF3322 domain-containing protein [Endozoicomonas sp. SCSIO W0465]